MSVIPRSYFQEHTFRTLEAMLDDTTHHDEAFRRLLRNKLSNGMVVFEDDGIDPQVATINSRIDYSVGRNWLENRVLVRSGGIEVFGLHLPITTLRGLALLGLPAGETIEVTRSDGAIEVLCLVRVCYQPEAHQKKILGRKNSVDVPEEKSSVVALGTSTQVARFNSGDMTEDPEDSDPGPSVA